MRKVVIGLSGGMDSATLLGLLLEQGAEVHCCTFYYGSKHGKWENLAAERIIEYYTSYNYPVHHYKIDISQPFDKIIQGSSLMASSSEKIPEGHYNDESMKSTVVPGRNMIFASLMAGLAESIGAEAIALGVHAGDHFIYPDCRPEFTKALDLAIYLSSDKKVQIITPLLHLSKTGILAGGSFTHKIPVPYHLTRTCYTDNEKSCGKCGSCIERLEAFTALALEDKIQYQ